MNVNVYLRECAAGIYGVVHGEVPDDIFNSLRLTLGRPDELLLIVTREDENEQPSRRKIFWIPFSNIACIERSEG